MKKIIALALAALCLLGMLTGCGKKNDETDDAKLTVIKVGASITPHAEILANIKDDLAAKGYDLQIVEFTDYVQPNLNVESGELHANYFQHKPYLDDFNAENGTHLVSVAAVHYEPFGVYPGQKKSFDELEAGDKIAVPNDGTNEARALMLLEAQGLIKLKEDVGFTATKIDIVENPKQLEIMEIEAAQLTISREDVAMAVINGNYAIQGGLNAINDSIAMEDKDSVAAETYANILCVKEGNEETEITKALVEALKSEAVKTFIDGKYEGAVVPKF